LYCEDGIIYNSIKIIVEKCENQSVVLYVHNINFDGILILECLQKFNIVFKLIKRNLNIYAIIFDYMGVNIEFRCSYKLLPLPLNVLALNIGLFKTPFPYKFVCEETLHYVGEVPNISFFDNEESYLFFLNKGEFDTKKETIRYCLNDIYVQKRILIEVFNFIEKMGENYLKILKTSYSIPSFSHKLFFKKYNTHSINKTLKLELKTYIKQSYFGGRCEVFGNQTNEEITHFFDFSGMYGQCMLQKFPTGKIKLINEKFNIYEPGFYHITYKSDMWLPVLPKHYKNKLIFSNGVSSGIFWYEELISFVQEGGVIQKINYGIVWENEDYVFKNFVNDFNKLRSLGGYKKTIGKLIINALYGSFAMEDDKNITVVVFNENEFYDILEKTNVANYKKLNNCYIIEVIKDYKSSIYYNKKNKMWDDSESSRNVVYASIISSKARIKLYNAFKSVMQDGGRLLYCDTDSVFAAYKSNNLSKSCGEVTWSEVYKDSMFISPKFYGYVTNKEKVLKIKGINCPNVDYDVVKKMFYEDKEVVKVYDNYFFDKKNYELKYKLLTKNIWLNKYDKRLFTKDKKSTTPTLINDD
jgi:hypothetical protein